MSFFWEFINYVQNHLAVKDNVPGFLWLEVHSSCILEALLVLALPLAIHYSILLQSHPPENQTISAYFFTYWIFILYPFSLFRKDFILTQEFAENDFKVFFLVDHSSSVHFIIQSKCTE